MMAGIAPVLVVNKTIENLPKQQRLLANASAPNLDYNHLVHRNKATLPHATIQDINALVFCPANQDQFCF